MSGRDMLLFVVGAPTGLFVSAYKLGQKNIPIILDLRSIGPAMCGPIQLKEIRKGTNHGRTPSQTLPLNPKGLGLLLTGAESTASLIPLPSGGLHACLLLGAHPSGWRRG